MLCEQLLQERYTGTVLGYFAPGERLIRIGLPFKGSGPMSPQAMQRFQNDTH